MGYKILFSNLGYARGIDGTLWQHIRRATRHLYCDIPVQKQVLMQVKAIMNQEKPDLCCFVEIDKGSVHSAHYNQMDALEDDDYRFKDIANKYGEENWRSRIPFYAGKSNAFISKAKLVFDRLYFAHGTKRLMYRVQLPNNVHVFFAHFSLQKRVRVNQFAELHQMVKQCPGDVIILADFNIMDGFKELTPLLEESGLKLLNKEDEYTFTFHNRRLTLDLCLCSASLKDRISLKVIPQPYSDHAALLVEI